MATTSTYSGTFKRRKGFQRTSQLLQPKLRDAVETRGFAQMRLLTHWEEIVGADTAKRCKPVKVSYAQGGFGATLIVLTTSAQAPMLEMDLPKIRDRVNACYGYNAIQRIRITQTAPSGFAEGQAVFRGKNESKPVEPSIEVKETAQSIAGSVENDELKSILASLAEKVIEKERRKTK